MTRLEELTWNLADDLLNQAEASELGALLAEKQTARETHIRILQIEAGLRASRQDPDLATTIMARLHGQVAESIAEGVMSQIRSQPIPEWVSDQNSDGLAAADFQVPPAPGAGPVNRRGWRKLRSLLHLAAPKRREDGRRGGLGRGGPSITKRHLKPALLSLAACVVLTAGVGIWLFGPTAGEPVLAEVQGEGLSLERAGKPLAAGKGMRLQAGDLLRAPRAVSAVISFPPERTRITLEEGAELKLVSISRGKRFFLSTGKLQAAAGRQRPFQPMKLTTPQAEARVLGTRFSLLTSIESTRLEVTEGTVRLTRIGDGVSTKVSGGNYAVASSNSVLAALPLTGRIFREYWTNVPGVAWTELIINTNYPDRPDGGSYFTILSGLEMPSNWADNYGVRLRGFLHPPRTGGYTFWIAAKDEASLYLSPDENPENKVHMAHSGDAAPRDWQRDASQQSGTVQLIAGRKYYFEVMHKAGVGDDSLAIAWQGPGREREVIPGEFLSPFEPKGKAP